MSSSGGAESRTVVRGDGQVLEGEGRTLEYRAEDNWMLGRVAVEHVLRRGLDDAEVEYGNEELRVKIPHGYSDGEVVHEYTVREDGRIETRHSFSGDGEYRHEDGKHRHITEDQWKRLVARANMLEWFVEEVEDLADENLDLAESVVDEYRWGPVLEPENLEENLREEYGEGWELVEEDLGERLAVFGSANQVVEGYADLYPVLLDSIARGERLDLVDPETGTKGRDLEDFYRDMVKGEEMRELYRKEMQWVMQALDSRTDMEFEETW
ncbi:MAG: hypothetical protein ABEJ62_00075 [Candidatus Nanohaloarchaea archaeon]